MLIKCLPALFNYFNLSKENEVCCMLFKENCFITLNVFKLLTQHYLHKQLTKYADCFKLFFVFKEIFYDAELRDI